MPGLERHLRQATEKNGVSIIFKNTYELFFEFILSLRS